MIVAMDFSTDTDADLARHYTSLVDGADTSSPDFDLARACELANELELRGFTESKGSWRHPEKGTLVTDP